MAGEYPAWYCAAVISYITCRHRPCDGYVFLRSIPKEVHKTSISAEIRGLEF